MQKRIISADTIQSTTVARRSPRFQPQKNSISEPQQPKTPRRPQDFNSNSSESRKKPSNPSPSSIKNVALPQSHKDSKKKFSKKSIESNCNSRSCIDGSTGSRRSSRLNNGVDGFHCLRRSSRLSNQKVFVDEDKDCPFKVMKKSSDSYKCSGDLQNMTPKPREPARLNGPVQSLRRSQRLLKSHKIYREECLECTDSDSNFSVEKSDLVTLKVMKKSSDSYKCSGDLQNMTPKPRESARLNGPVQSLRRSQRLLKSHKIYREECLECTDSDSNFSVEKSDLVNGPVQSLRRSHRLLNSHKTYREECLECTDSDLDFSVEKWDLVVASKAKEDGDSSEKSLCNSGKGTGQVSVAHGELIVESGEGKRKNEDRSKTGVNRKRKRSEDGAEIMKGWTKEQEVALQRAYLAAKPTPHFWKKVSRLVPGKSAQDCFDRIHGDHSTPPQPQPRSRAKTSKFSPLEQFTLSASKLLEPIDKKIRRSKFLKPKNRLTRKSVQKMLQRHRKVDQDHEGDLFSVFEPDMDLSTNSFQPSDDALSTPMQQKENQGFLQGCSETSSLRHKKSLSKLSSSCITDLVSPPVLKQVKNRVLHDKYINQLLCREARRRAASARVGMSVTGKTVGKENSFQKRDVVKAAKTALVSEARDAISKFQRSQANFMGITCSSDEDNDDGIGVESTDNFEDESQ